jgi:ureidoacrylate peracid hydrolase
MHNVQLSASIVDRVTARRGGLHVFPTIMPARTALIVVDLQNGFMAPGAVCELPLAREIVPNVNRLAAATRAAGGMVVFLHQTFRPEDLVSWSTFFDHFSTPGRKQALLEAFTPGSEGHALWPALVVDKDDVLVNKNRFGAFVPGSSNLHEILQQHGIDTLIITGTATNVCCESTARDAMMMNYKVFFVADGNATFADAEHNATLNAMAHGFCDVIETDEMLGLITQVSAQRSAA